MRYASGALAEWILIHGDDFAVGHERGRERIEDELQKLIDERSNPWGVTVQSVEMRDVVIPDALQDAMSREAQAAREKQARIILGQAEMEIAHSFEEAAKSYQHNPVALHLRAMNMLYEGLKEKGALMLIPSSAVESMGMGGLMGAAALSQANEVLLACVDAAAEQRMKAVVDEAYRTGDTAGGVFEIVAHNVPPGDTSRHPARCHFCHAGILSSTAKTQERD